MPHWPLPSCSCWILQLSLRPEQSPHCCEADPEVSFFFLGRVSTSQAQQKIFKEPNQQQEPGHSCSKSKGRKLTMVDSDLSQNNELRKKLKLGLTQTGRVDGLDRLLHLVENTAVHIQSLCRHTNTPDNEK